MRKIKEKDKKKVTLGIAVIFLLQWEQFPL
jgi:hypothetical protein